MFCGNFDFANNNKLPSLLINLDEEAIAKAYLSKGFISSSGFNGDNKANQYRSSLYKTDEKIHDVINLFSKYITNELILMDYEKYGTIDIKDLNSKLLSAGHF